MSMKRRHLYFAVIAAGGGFLLVDTLFMAEGVTEPQQAVGATGEPLGVAQPPDTPADELTSIPELPFPYAVAEYSLSPDAPDPFAPPKGADDGRATDLASDKHGRLALGADSDGKLDRTEFIERHVLDGVLDQGRLKIAIVDGEWLRPGDVLDGCTLKTVAGSEARFECFDGYAVLRFGDKAAHTRD